MAGVLRELAAPLVVPGPSGVSVRTRLRPMPEEEAVLREVGAFLGSLAGRDLAARCRDGLDHDSAAWAMRKRALTGASSSRWAGSITKASHDQWALSRRCQRTHLAGLDAGIATVQARLARPIGAPGSRDEAKGYRSRAEWHAKSRRLHVLKDRREQVAADVSAGRVHVVRGGRRLATTRHHLEEAGLTEEHWHQRWAAARMFLSADGESGAKHGNQTIRVTPDGRVSLKLPAALAHLANAPHGRYALAVPVAFAHRDEEWADRIAADRAVAYTIAFDAERGRWYLTAAWQRKDLPVLSPEAALAAGCIGVDMNDDHLAAWQLDRHGNPLGEPRRFGYDLSGTADHRDAQIRHALTRTLHWARTSGVRAIAVEDLDFAAEKSREKHGGKKRFRRLISRFPTAKLRNRLAAMAAEQDITVIAVDPAYTSKWAGQHWQKPLTTPARKTTRHDAASVVIGRRAQGFGARRRTAPPHCDRMDRSGHRTAQAAPGRPGREGPRPPRPGPHAGRVPPPGQRTRGTSAPSTVRGTPSERGQSWQQDPLPLTG